MKLTSLQRKAINYVLIVLSTVYLMLCLEVNYREKVSEVSGRVGQEDNEDTCQEVRRIVFLKTHKCASSSLQNIFFRFGEKQKLNFVLPQTGHILKSKKRSKTAGLKLKLSRWLHIRVGQPQLLAAGAARQAGPGRDDRRAGA